MASFDQGKLSRNGIDRIDHIIILRKIELIRCFRQKEHPVRRDKAIRIDGTDPLLRNLDLASSDRVMRRDDLPVQIRQNHLIVIDQIDGSDAAPDKRFHRVSAHAADSKHSDPASGQPPDRFRAENNLRS